MADHSNIEWTEASWTVVTGCEHVSPACDHCYAAKLTSGRLRHLPEYTGLANDGVFTGEVRLLPERLDWPLRWRKPRRIFVCSMSDLFHKDVPDEFIARVFAVMAATPQHTYQVLTKRHARMRWLVRGSDGSCHRLLEATTDEETARAIYDAPWPLPNVWLGVSVEDQKWADIRIPVLLDTPAAVRWISAEPLLGPVDLHWCGGIDAIEQDWIGGPGGGSGAPHPFLNWVVIGGESGPGARPMALDWARTLINECQLADVPAFVKQLGSRWGRGHHDMDRFPDYLQVRDYPEVIR